MRALTNYTDDELIALSNTDIEAELKSRGYKYGWYRDVVYKGCIYILVNPAFDNLVKIGYADDIAKRLKQLNANTGLPDPFHVYAIYRVKERLDDLRLHKLIDSLDSDLRHSKNREFYEMSVEKAYDIIAAIAEINGDMDRLIKNPLNDDYFNEIKKTVIDEVDNQGRTRKSRLSFSELEIPVGAELRFIEDPNIIVNVAGNSTVMFENKIYKLSALARELKTRNGTANSSGAYQGGSYFTYKGKKLVDIRNEKDKTQ